MARSPKIKPLGAAPWRIPRGEPAYDHAQCKREIRKHVDALLGAYSKGHPGRTEGAEDVFALALETIATEVDPTDDGHQGSVNLRRQDLLLARYVLKQVRRLVGRWAE